MAKYRSAITGKYVSEYYAKRHPSTTVKETNADESREVPAEKVRRGEVQEREAEESHVEVRAGSSESLGA